MLTALAVIAAMLLALGLAPYVWQGARRFDILGLTAGGLCGIALLLALAALVTGDRSMLTLPIGLPGSGMVLVLDPLAAFFLLPVCVSGIAAGICAGRMPPLLPVFVGAMMLTLLAGDPAALVLGFLVMGAAGWGLVGGAGLACMAATGPVCALAALAMLPGPGFDAMRAAPPEGWRAAAVLVLTLLGAGPAIGLVPLHRWLPPAYATASGPVAALLAGGMARVGVYVLIRIVLDLCGPATPGWWCAPLLALGLASAILGAMRANQAPTLQGVLAGLAMQNAGFIAAALGVALVARGADLPLLASLALGGAMLHALNHGVVQVLAILCADVAGHSAATGTLDRLGGLARAMPRTTACLLVAVASFAMVPLSAGFAGFWVLLQTVIAAPRIGGLGLQLALTLVMGGMGLAAALGAAAVVRMIGIGFLGRPRSPRTAAAEDPSGLVQWTLYGLAGVSIVLGLVPGMALALTNGARQALSAAGLRQRTDWTGIDAVADIPGYLPLGVAGLLAVAGLGLWLVIRRLPAPRTTAAWDGGFAASPPWLPFGDPATQYGAASLNAPVIEVMGGARWWSDPMAPWLTRTAAWFARPALAPRSRLALAVLLAVALAALAGAAWLEGA
ncbi:MAG: proton-conducting transporter membrane subunit [Janthinobacterium lividum]